MITLHLHYHVTCCQLNCLAGFGKGFLLSSLLGSDEFGLRAGLHGLSSVFVSGLLSSLRQFRSLVLGTVVCISGFLSFYLGFLMVFSSAVETVMRHIRSPLKGSGSVRNYFSSPEGLKLFYCIE